jgi:hypothetical protein
MDKVQYAIFILILVSIIFERALSVVFDQYFYKKYFGQLHIKEFIAFALSIAFCELYSYDVLSALELGPISYVGKFISALAITGGNKVSIRIFKDFMGIINAKNDRPTNS